MNRLDKQRAKAQAKGNHAQASPRKLKPTEHPNQSARKHPLPPLPIGSRDGAEYVAAGCWKAWLEIPKGDGEFQRFEAEARARFTALSRLDRMYRAWLSTLGVNKA